MKFKNLRKAIKIRTLIVQTIQIVIGTSIIAAAIAFFLLPNHISSGGFAGIGTITYYLLKIPIGIAVLVLNIPLFIIAWIKGGRKYFFNALFGTALLSVFLNLFEDVNVLTTDKLLASIYGGIMVGVGTALVLRANASTGGTELLANIVRMYKPGTRTSIMIMIFDAIVVTANIIFFREIEVGLYSAIVIYLMGKVIDIVFEGIDFAKIVYIISPEYEKIAKEITTQMRRGITSLYGKGMYKQEEKQILFCVVSRGEVREVRKIVNNIDHNAFIVISNAREVFGEGFKETKK